MKVNEVIVNERLGGLVDIDICNSSKQQEEWVETFTEDCGWSDVVTISIF